MKATAFLVALISLVSTSFAMGDIDLVSPPFNGTLVKASEVSYVRYNSEGNMLYNITSRWVHGLNGRKFGGWRAFDGNPESFAQGYRHYNARTGIPSCRSINNTCQYHIQLQYNQDIYVHGLRLMSSYPESSYPTAYRLFGCPCGANGFVSSRCQVILKVENANPNRENGIASFGNTISDPENRKFSTFILVVDRLNEQPDAEPSTRISAKVSELRFITADCHSDAWVGSPKFLNRKVYKVTWTWTPNVAIQTKKGVIEGRAGTAISKITVESPSVYALLPGTAAQCFDRLGWTIEEIEDLATLPAGVTVPKDA